MRPRTMAAVGLLVVVLGAALAFGLGGAAADGRLAERWVSDTGRDVGGNHHAPAVGRVGGQPMVFAPVSGSPDTDDCALVALDGTDGSQRWTYPIPPEVCTIHSVADPTLADYDGDGVVEVLAATTEQTLVALESQTGTVEFRYPLSSYGYTAPVVADLTGDGASEVVVVDVRGTVFVLRPDGTVVWTTNLSRFTWGQPAVADIDGDGADELVVGLGGTGAVSAFEANGSVRWRRADLVDGSLTWMTTGQADDDPGIEIAVATAQGTVAVIDGREGALQWRADLGSFAAVHALDDGDGDGDSELYAVARDGVLRSLDARTGAVEWETTLTAARVQMTPPPSLGDLDGDGDLELVAVTNDGTVSVVDPTTGEVLASYARTVPIYVHPTLADVDGDGAREVVVMYGDGRVVALSYRG